MGAGAVKITIEAEGYRLVINDDDLDSFGLSLPRDTVVNPDGTREMYGQIGITLVGQFKEDFRPLWEEIDG